MKDFKKVIEGFRKVFIQTHNNPDADAIASAWAMKCLIDSFQKEVEIIYSGSNIFKPNIRNLLMKFNIEMTYISDNISLKEDELLLIVDGQRGAGNMLPVNAEYVAVIDHHFEGENQQYIFRNIQPRVGSCATLVFTYLSKYGFEIDSALATILYFGIMMDTDMFTGKMTTLDYDVRQKLEELYDKKVIDYLRLSSLSYDQVPIIANGLLKTERYRNIIFSRIEECDDNLLGHIADLLAEIDGIDIVIVFSARSSGYKLSIRSYHEYLTAEEFAIEISEGLGSGGGHTNKAGAYIRKDKFERLYPVCIFAEYIRKVVIDYCKEIRFLQVGQDNPYVLYSEDDIVEAKKKKIYLRYLELEELFDEEVTIKTLEGVVSAKPSDIVIIGIESEIWPVSAELFSLKYKVLDDEIGHCVSDEYIDEFGITLQSESKFYRITKENINKCKVCVTTDQAIVKAIQLTEKVKVRSSWGDFNGKKGDYLMINSLEDYYICNREIFEQTYSIL
ncbi:MAG: DHH family phosphoesterase [Halanaerobiales bacterium]